MSKRIDPRPVALTIAGSDSGGGAGIQADLKTFAALGVHGASAIACLTAQHPLGVSAIQPCGVHFLQSQIDAVFAAFQPAAVKTGMLYSARNIRVVAEFFERRAAPPLIVDPVMIATSGGRLLRSSALRVLRDELLPRAALVTPNVSEAQTLAGFPIAGPEDLRRAARHIHAQAGCAVLVKGGHLRGVNDAVDIFYDGKTELLLSAPLVKGISTHGTGCTYSAAIAAYLALGRALPEAVRLAKEYITQAIARSFKAGGHWILNHFCVPPRQRNAICYVPAR